jgi:two-component system, chemotaxis family, sensor kinase CheA
MAERDDLGERLRATFLQELDEQVHELNAGLLALEQGSAAPETVRSLFRSAHTIKGAARVAGVAVIEEACHALESVFADVRDARRRLAGADFSLLFAVVDALADAGARLRGGSDAAGGPLAALLPRLAGLAAAEGADGDGRPTSIAAANAAAAPVAGAAAAGGPDPAGEAAPAGEPASAGGPATAHRRPAPPTAMPGAASRSACRRTAWTRCSPRWAS